jgi:membrane-associated phospholipid phosphatase
MSERRATFWHWPGWGQFGYCLLLGLALGLWFEVIYAGANYITSLHDYRVRVHFDAELGVPFVPASVLGYDSIYLLFLLPAFVLRTRRELQALSRTLASVMFVAGIFFLAIPAQAAFPPPGEMGAWTELVQFTKWIALTHNYVPSLHVAMTVVCVQICARQAPPFGRAALWLWAVGIGLSTMLLHQHYLIDVVSGFALGMAGVWLVYDRFAAPGADLASRAA